MEPEIKARLKWLKLYEETGNISLVCRRCGISRPTFYKWLNRYNESGEDGLNELSRAPKTSPNTKIGRLEETWILNLRKNRKLGARRIQNELLRLHECSLSLRTIHKVLKRHNVKPLSRKKRLKTKRYQRPIPGDRIQMDTCKISNGIFQYTAIDDCTRYRVLSVYPRRTAENTLLFIEKVVEETPFPIQRIQTDRGREFFATKVQKELMLRCIKFRPIKPRSPHLNGKVERSQRTDLDEFYSTIDIPHEDLESLLQEWQHFYNWNRPHGSLGGKPPMEKYFELSEKTPFWDDVEAAYVPEKERVRESNYYIDQKIAKCK